MWCNCNGWSSCGCGRQITRSCGCGRQSTCGCGSARDFDCGCDQYEEDDFSLERVGSLPLFISIPTWLNGENNSGRSGCGCG